MTKEDKIYIGSGIALVIAGAGFWWYKSKKSQDNSTQETIDIPYQDVTNTPQIKVPAIATPPIATTTASAPVREPEPVKVNPKKLIPIAVGQEVMANVTTGLKCYDVQRKANGDYYTNKNHIETIDYGKKIGFIKAILKRSDGTYRYVVEQTLRASFGDATAKRLLWCPDGSVLVPIGKIIPVKENFNVPAGLILTRNLHRGIYDSPEVKELQKRLGLTQDGDFGLNTEKALFTQKKVKQIRLADWK